MIEPFGYLFPSADDAAEVFERLYATLHDGSVWRTATPDLVQWHVVGLADPAQLEGFDWKLGTPFEVDPDQIDWMVGRRLLRALQADADGSGHINERNHFHPETAPRIPGTAIPPVERTTP